MCAGGFHDRSHVVLATGAAAKLLVSRGKGTRPGSLYQQTGSLPPCLRQLSALESTQHCLCSLQRASLSPSLDFWAGGAGGWQCRESVERNLLSIILQNY